MSGERTIILFTTRRSPANPPKGIMWHPPGSDRAYMWDGKSWTPTDVLDRVKPLPGSTEDYRGE